MTIFFCNVKVNLERFLLGHLAENAIRSVFKCKFI